MERWFFADWHAPFDNVLEPEHMDRMVADVQQMPSEAEGRVPVNSWSLEGPLGMANAGDGFYSGRILDFDVPAGLRFAAASGGIWRHELVVIFPIPVPMSDDLSALAAGSLATDPTNHDRILLGTGEPYQRSGTGLYLTTDVGETWQKVTMSPQPSGFFRVRFSPDGATAHAATTSGYYRSTDGGLTWTRTLSINDTTDLAIDPTNANVLYTTVYYNGVYKSTNAGATWTKLTTGLPTTDIGRGAIVVANNPAKVYVAIADSTDSSVLGVYKSTNFGSSWTAITPADNYMGGQGWYDNTITVDPDASDTVLVGGVTLYRTTDAGTTWTKITDPDLHVDYHAFAWSEDAGTLWAGHDGGWSSSTNSGLTWTSLFNYAPITQYYNIGVRTMDGQIMGGGSQDNGLSVSTDSGSSWTHSLGGDGGAFTVEPELTDPQIWATNGVYGGDWTFRRLRTPDLGVSWFGIDTGVDPSTQWLHRIRHDNDPSVVYLYNNSGHWVYRSVDYGDTWVKLNSSNEFSTNVSELTVPPYISATGTGAYACLSSSTTGDRLWVYDNGTWFERSAGLPTGMRVRKVAVHSRQGDTAYALMNGLGNAGQKIYKTTNRGVSWTNVSGNLPDVALADLIPHPTDGNKLYVGSEMGCFRTLDGGTTWHRWNSGMPEANIVTEMTYIDELGTTGNFYIVAGTYGRGIWKREVTGYDATIFEDGFETGNTSQWSSTTP